MPGTLWRVECGSCGRAWTAMAGASEPALHLPALCPHCREIVTADGREDGDWRCASCGGPCEPLPGAALDPGEELPPRLVGVGCPICSRRRLGASSHGLWD